MKLTLCLFATLLVLGGQSTTEAAEFPMPAQVYLASHASEIGLQIEVLSIYRANEKERLPLIRNAHELKCLEAQLKDLSLLPKLLEQTPAAIATLATKLGKAAPLQISLWDNEGGKPADETVLKRLYVEYVYRQYESGAPDSRFVGIGIDSKGHCLRPPREEIVRALQRELHIGSPDSGPQKPTSGLDIRRQ